MRACHRAVFRLREEVRAEAAETVAGWSHAIQRREFRDGAENLAAYLALRRRDISQLQERLVGLGLSSLERCEPRVLPSLDALCDTLDALLKGHPRRGAPSTAEEPDALLRETNRIFGTDSTGPSTRILVTLPTDAAVDGALVRRAIEAGADCVRINCAHDEPDAWSRMIRHARAAARRAGRRCPVLMDLAGPKIRLTHVSPESDSRLKRGAQFQLTSEPQRGTASCPVATVSHPEVLRTLRAGAEVWINDGKLGAKVVSIAADRATLEVVHAREKGERLRPGKGLNVPATPLDIPALTRKDLRDLDFVATHADGVAYSFVQQPEDILRLQQELARRGRPRLPLILKIETAEAVRQLPRLIVAAAGRQPVAVMIARGDLAVEIGRSRLSEVQEQILWICEAARVPVIWATQVLENLLKTGAPSRGEATDAAMGQRAECVMLNKGPYLVEAVAFLDDVLRRMDRHQVKRAGRLAALKSWTERQTLPRAFRRARAERPTATRGPLPGRVKPE